MPITSCNCIAEEAWRDAARGVAVSRARKAKGVRNEGGEKSTRVAKGNGIACQPTSYASALSGNMMSGSTGSTGLDGLGPTPSAASMVWLSWQSLSKLCSAKHRKVHLRRVQSFGV